MTRQRHRVGAALAAGALLLAPFTLACGGGGDEPERPTATAASTNSGGGSTHWGGGGGSGGSSVSLGGLVSGRVGGMPGGSSPGGPIGDALRRRRREREEAMLERLGPVRLTEDGSETWPMYEGAIRRVDSETSSIEDPCERMMAAGEIITEEMAGDAMGLGERLRDMNCRAYDETYANCAQEDYASAHEEECGPLLRRAERLRSELNEENPDPRVLTETMGPERRTARRAGLAVGPAEDEVEPTVLPDLNLPTRGR
jgi:hypothetical protein